MGFIMYVCPQCRKIFKISGNGKKAKCPKCNDSILLETGVEESIWQTYTPDTKKEIISSMLDESEVIEVEELVEDDNKPTEKKSSFFDVDISDTPPVSNLPVRNNIPSQPDRNTASTQSLFGDDSGSYFEPNLQSNKATPVSSSTVSSSNAKNSTLSIVALIFCILGCFSIIGVVLAIWDLTKNGKDGKKHVCSIIGLGFCAVWLLVGISNMRSVNKKEEASKPTPVTEEVNNVEEAPTPEPVQEVAESEPVQEDNNSSSETAPIVIPNIDDLEFIRIDDARADEFYKAQTIDKRGESFKGNTVLTYGTIYNDASEKGYLQINVPGTVHGIDCYLAKDSNCKLSDLTDDNTAIVVGTISGAEDLVFYKQVKMVDCYVIGVISTASYDSSALDMVISRMDDDVEGLLNHVGYSTDGLTIDNSETVASDSSDSSSDSSDSLFGTHDVDTENAIETTAKSVYKELKDNQVACKNKYDGKTIKLTGVIDNIGTNVFGQEYVSFDVGDPYSIEGVQVFFKNDQMDYVASLKKGQTITIYGIADIGSMTFKMGNCFPAD